MDEWMNERLDKWMDALVDGWMNEWMEEQTSHSDGSSAFVIIPIFL